MPWNLSPNAEQTVLVPYDFSTASADALTSARALVERPEQLVVVHIVLPVSTASPGFLAGEIDDTKVRARAEAELLEVLTTAGLGAAERRVLVGDPASEIIDVAREVDANLIVIPSRGKTGLRRWIIGSVAERVVRHARCPVLVLPILDEDGDGNEEGS